MSNGTFIGGASYLARLEHFNQFDKEREDMIKELVSKCQDLEQRLEDKTRAYDNEFQIRTLYQTQANDAGKKLTDIYNKTDVNSFAFAIIDGDGAVFRDEWIRMEEEGGAIAAHQLRTDIKQHLKEIYPNVNVEPWLIIVQIVLNIGGLSRKLRSINLTEGTGELFAFARGFTRSQGLFSFIDVGSGKEQADFKVRETLRLMVNNLQCKHIIFGPCHDKGYIVELRPHQLETSISSKLSLLETTPAPRDFKELSLRRVKFPNVFRSELLPDGPPPPPTISSTLAPTQSTYASISSTWRNNFPLINEFKRFTISSEKPAKSTCTDKYYLINSSGERIDEPLPQYDPESEKSFRERGEKEARGPCNRYHIYGNCEEFSCTYYHGDRLVGGELLILKAKARGSFCFNKSGCTIADCLWGHHCKYGAKKCQKRATCPFFSTHDMDLTAAEKVYTDGSREKLSP